MRPDPGVQIRFGVIAAVVIAAATAVIAFVPDPFFRQADPFHGILIQRDESHVNIGKLRLLLRIGEDDELPLVIDGVAHPVQM